MPFRLDDDEIEVLKDVPYESAHGKRGLLDVYRQRDTEVRDAPVLLHVHGGAWSIGDKEHQGLPLMLHMAARGWVCVTINYRLSPRDAVPRAPGRREAGDRLDPGPGCRLRRRPGLRRDHGWLGGRAPGRPGRTHAQRPGVPARLRGRRHDRAGGRPALRRLRLRGRHRDEEGAAAARSLPGPQGAVQGPAQRAGGVREGVPAAAGERSGTTVPRGARRPRLAGRRRPGPPVRPGAARCLPSAGRLRRAARHPARVRRVPLDPSRRPWSAASTGSCGSPTTPGRRRGPSDDRHVRGPVGQGGGRQGIHARGRGRPALRRRGPRPGRGARARGGHLLRQVRDLPGRRGPRGRQHGVHRRPPPRVGGEPGRLGAP